MFQSTARKLDNGISNWLRDESGNATIDWVVLVSGVVGMAFTVMLFIGGGMEVFGDRAETELTAREVGID